MFRWTVARSSDNPEVARGQPPAGFLSPAERARFAQFRFSARKSKYLLGRLAAKKLLLEALRADGVTAEPSEITVANEPSGAPYAEVRGLGRLPLDLSLSNREGLGLAVLAEQPGLALGADLELVTEREPGLVRDFFAPEEIACVSEVSGRDAQCLVARTWSAKESVLKAMKIGLRMDTRRIVIDAAVPARVGPPPDGWQQLWAEVGDHRAVFRVLWRDEGDYVITVALPTDGRGRVSSSSAP